MPFSHKLVIALAVVMVFASNGYSNGGKVAHDYPLPHVVSYVRVVGNKIIDPAGNPLFLKIGVWVNLNEGSVTAEKYVEFLNYAKTIGINCVLLKANMWLVKDDGWTHDQRAIDMIHWGIKQANDQGMYVILNMFDVWSRGKGGKKYNINSTQHPVNVWKKGHTAAAVHFVKMITREYIKYPMVLFELGNEMAHKPHGQDWKDFFWMAKNHLLPHFYAIAGKDRPIGVSEQNLWPLPVNMIFNHNPNRINQVNPEDRPIVTNELAHGSKLWRDHYIRSSDHSQKYFAAFSQAKSKGHSGIAAASGLDINTPLNKTAKHVLSRLGEL
jgi:hypothetical protein